MRSAISISSLRVALRLLALTLVMSAATTAGAVSGARGSAQSATEQVSSAKPSSLQSSGADRQLSQASDGAGVLLQQARAAYEQKLWDQAEALLTQALSASPDPITLVEIHLNLASIQMQQRDRLQAAEGQLQAAEQGIPAAQRSATTGPWAVLWLETLVQRMQFHQRNGEDIKALNSLQSAHRLYQTLRSAGQAIPTTVAIPLANGLRQLGKVSDAQRLLVGLPETSVALRTLQGSLAARQGKLEEAKRLFKAAAALSASPEEARYLKFEQAQLAADELRRQEDTQLFSGLVKTCDTLKRVKDALDKFEGADRLDPPTQVQANLAQLQLLTWVLPQVNQVLVRDEAGMQKLTAAQLKSRCPGFPSSAGASGAAGPLITVPTAPAAASPPNAEPESQDEDAQLESIYCTALKLNQRRLDLIEQLQGQLAGGPSDRLGVDHRINFATSLLQSAAVYNQGKGLPLLTAVAKKVEQQVKISDQQAVMPLNWAIKAARTLNYPAGEAQALTLLAQIYDRAGQAGEALRLAERGLAIGNQGPAMAYRLQWQIARSQRKSDSKAACSSYQTTVGTVQSLRRNLVAVNQDVQYSFRDQVLPIYREAIETCLQADGAQPSNERLVQIRGLLESLQLAELDNFFKEACIEGRPQQMDSLIDRPNSKAAAIYTIVSDNRLDVLVKLPNQKELLHQSYAVSRADVERSAQAFSLLVRRNSSPQDPDVINSRESGQLYRWLVGDAKIQQALAKSGTDTLVFVLDGSLRNLPIAALVADPNAEKPFLIQRYALAITPGLQFAFDSQVATPKSYSRSLGGGLTEDPRESKYPPLQTATTELETVKRNVSPQQSETIIGTNFTAQVLENKLNKTYFPIVHLATHAQFLGNSDKTFIVTQSGNLPVDQFSNLLRQSFQQHNLPIELLVMSACETAQGGDRSVLGLSAIATRSGVRSTLGTLWRIPDAEPGEEEELRNQFIQTFYTNLTTTAHRAKALQAAQIAQISQTDVSTWAAFVLVGEWQ
jgi:CHAT domain-containing protein/predicted negative regulator of RcsB-dependent stress response